jgi:hypothetical protein
MSNDSLACKLAQQHGQIVDTLRSARGAENRRAPRFEHRARSQIFPCNNGKLATAVPVQLQDFSNRGLSFHLKAAMIRGEQFVFQLPRTDAGTTPVLCTVAYCRRSSDSEFRVGAEFTCIVRTDGPCILPDTGDVDRIKQSILS